MESKSVKEILELIAAIKEVAMFGDAIFKDGKVSIADLPQLMKLVDKQAVLLEGFKGVKEIPAEVKDLSIEEVQEIAGALLAAIKEVKAA